MTRELVCSLVQWMVNLLGMDVSDGGGVMVMGG